VSQLRGGKELRARLKAIGQVFKPYGRIWADDAAAEMKRAVPVRTGRLKGSIRRRNATAKRATVVGHYSSNFVDAGSRAHDINAKRAPFLVFQAGGQTIFAKRVHKQRIAARPFKRRAALKALRDNPMSDELKKLWNNAA
jgi:hypothetical protein